NLIKKGDDKKKIIKHLKEKNNQLDSNDISRIDIYYWDNDQVASRSPVDTSFTRKRIESITDTGIQKILLKHLESKNKNPEIAFSQEGIEDMNKNMQLLNNGKQHQPILKVRTYETKGNKFAVGYQGNKKDKYVEAAKGTNLFFAIYQGVDNKRNYDTIPVNIKIERLKQGLPAIPERNEKGDKLLFHLSPNDIVYIPDETGANISKNNFHLNQEQSQRIYRFVSCTGSEGHFVQNNYSTGIINNEQGT